MNIWSAALAHFIVDIFSAYVVGTDAAMIFRVQIRYMWFY
jgi:hypothetical protein